MATELDTGLVGPDSSMHAQPSTGNGKGSRITLEDEAEIRETNVRVLGNMIRMFKTTPIFMPKEQPIQLVLLRIIFNQLKHEYLKKCGAYDIPAVERNEVQSAFADSEMDKIPTVTFARVFERLFFLLGDLEDFDPASYDPNGDGYVTWAEFFDVYRHRNITVKWTLCERIFYTLEDPDSSISATVVSFLVLFVIIVSSFCFIFSTVPAFQRNLDHKDGPKPIKILDVIDGICLVIFVVEYLTRLLTCWNVRTEISRKNQTALGAIVVGVGPISVPSPLWRLVYFFFAPANLVDLVAILPGVLGAFLEIEGGGFVVLRLIRLTRLFRVFKSKSLIEPVIIIGRTLSQSTSALNILMFNLLLGVIIAGSLIFIVEGLGTWDVENQVYLRVNGQEWNETTGEFVPLTEPTPFASIPDSFWWALVTIMTVGYGDHYPTTGLGKVIAGGTMMFSLVMLALPVGVVGGNFSQVWADFEQTKKNDEETLKEEEKFVMTQMAQLDPDRLSKMMLVEVWDDSGIPNEGLRQGPRFSYFMGQATCHLDLPCDVISEKQVTLKLKANPDIVDRKIKGSVAIKYKWTPHPRAANADQVAQAPSGISQLHGSLEVTVLSGRRLLNLVNKGSSKTSASSPYCCVYVYPKRPAEGAMLVPAVWQTPTHKKDLSPIWDVTDTFMYEWRRPDLAWNVNGRNNSPAVHEPHEPPSWRQNLELDDEMLDEALTALNILKNEMNGMKEQMKNLKAVVDEKELQATGLGIASTQAEEEDIAEVQASDGDLSSVAPEDEESV